MNSKNSINVAVIGTGNEGANLVSILSECPSTNVVGLCDPDLSSLKTTIAHKLGVPLFDRIEQLPAIGEVDLIIDVSDGAVAVKAVEELDQVEILRGRSAEIIKVLIRKREGCGEGDSESLTNIFKIGSELASLKSSRQIHEAIVEKALEVTGMDVGCLVVFNEKSEVCRLTEEIGLSKKSIGSTWELQPGGFTERLLDSDGPLFVSDVNSEPTFDNPVLSGHSVSVLATALREGEYVIGFLYAGSSSPKQASDKELASYSAYASQASMALQKALLIDKNKELTVTDCLTGLGNSQSFFAALNTEIERARRSNSHFSVLLIELDNLSYINDYCGYTKGDWALKKIADILRSCSRQIDYKARQSGNEFAMILPNTKCSQASILANRIRRQVNDLFVKNDGREVGLSVSVGIAEYPSVGADSDALMSAAGTALFICKQRGRNLVCCYEDSGGSSKPF